MRYLLTLSSFVAAVLAAARTSAPSGALTVGSKGTYSTFQKAVSALSTTSTSAQSIFIYSGTYSEQVTIPALKGKLTVYGYTKDTSSYTDNVVNIEHSSSLLSGAASDEETGTVINLSENTAFYNINIKNTYGKGSQAIALAAYNTEQGYYGVGLYGYQDTLLTQTGNQVYAKCYIEGAVDWIFGQHSVAWFDGSVIAASAGGGCITANGRASSSDPSFYVINKCTITTSSSSTAGSKTVYLGRPWTEYARVAYQKSSLGSIIESAGWSEWSTSAPRTGDVLFAEYDNSGPGASGTRASFASTYSTAYTISGVLGSSYSSWVDTTYLS
ncbi:putative Pectinesterase [Sclerotinia borealis F-4128]|uniref:pectinesterase n=1 Tax=Sclerotinia borealis (strain F-4128) TaxID=1432307 RepID=W9CBH6_SCLBF|nr:putative Pectinesterase [Sclerotinia borealis F-4128]